MEASSRYLDPERGQLGRRRRHVPQISISDDSHHVTEAIGDLYGDSEWPKREATASKLPSSSSPREGRFDLSKSYFDSGSSTMSYDTTTTGHNAEGNAQPSNGAQGGGRRRKSSMGSNHSAQSPPLLTRTNSDTSSQHFPLNDIDYESSPAAVAQELSNLQAIRRMSMNVEAADPDLPSFGPTFSIPTAAPSHNADEDDEARMFWVPARLHPELAPKEFKTFVEDRVERIQRRSHEGSEGSSDGFERSGSKSSINRRKSTLSRTIDSGIGYQDGADVLERKRSRSSQTSLDFPDTSLQELSQTFNDPVELVRKISIDSSRRPLEAGSEAGADGDVPILPVAPGGQALKRSTRTNYRRGSLRKGERVPPSRRATLKGRDTDDEQMTPKAPPNDTHERPSMSEDQQHGLSRVRTEPTLATSEQLPDNFSRPSRRGRPMPQPPSVPSSVDEQPSPKPSMQPVEPLSANRNPKSFVSRLASNSRTTAHIPAQNESRIIPQIIEPSAGPAPDQRHSAPPQPAPQLVQHPERKSSHDYGRQAYTPQPSPMGQPQMKNGRRPNKTLDDMANSPWMMPGQSTSTDALTFIPSFTEDREERKPEKKAKERKDSESGSRKPSWGWLLGGQNQDSEEKKERKEEKELSKKSKVKTKQPVEKPHDSTRLDLLNTASDTSRPRESLVLDRDSIKLDEERRKESSSRKSAGTESKTGASGIFSTLFGGKKKASDRDARKGDTHRRLSPEPPPRHLRADIDYNWTRFSILEERAIYRMAHLKLANPRRALHSQVLLSNFMYSYLAKVQQMHPSIQIPAFVQKQQKSPPSEQQDQSQQSDEFSAWQRYQEQHDQDKTAGDSSNGSAFVEDYDPGHQQEEDSRRQEQQQRYHGQRYANSHGTHGQQYQGQRNDHYAEQGSFDGGRPPEDEKDLW